MRAVCHSIATPSIITKSEQGRVIINTSLQSAEARAFIYIGYDSRYAYTAYFPHTKKQGYYDQWTSTAQAPDSFDTVI